VSATFSAFCGRLVDQLFRIFSRPTVMEPQDPRPYLVGRFIVIILILSEYALLFSVLLLILVTTVILKDQTRCVFSNDRRPPTLVTVLGAPSDNVEILVLNI